MKKESDSKIKSAVKSMILTDRLHRNAVESQINELGIHRSQHLALRYIMHGGPDTTQTEIAKALEISPAAVTVTLKKLEKSGLITRVPQESDARANSIMLTDEAKTILKKSCDIFKTVNSAMCEGITEEELDAFISCTAKMIENLKKYSSEKDTEGKAD